MNDNQELEMPDNSSSNKRIAKNTIILYVGMLYGLLVSLFTARIVLRSLGEVDYGIYDVVGSIVAMFVFLRSVLGNATHRFITYSIGKGNLEETKNVFSTALIIHMGLSLLIVLLAETIGLYFLYHKMVIPAERMYAAQWCFQFSVLTCALSVISVPYDAAIIAHEKMSIYAAIQIFQSTMNLVIAFILTITNSDKLIVYGFMILLTQVLIRVFYGFYCNKHFEESHFKWGINYPLLKSMTSFAGWKIISYFAWMAYTQGVNILLNMFFGPVVNAARAIAIHVQGAINGFITNFQTSVNPQITKSYAQSDFRRLHELIFLSSKYSYLLLLLFVLPIFVETEQIMHLWLGEYPEHTVSFVRLSLLVMLIEPLANPIGIANDATGDLKRYQITTAILNLSIFFLSYLFLKIGKAPEIVFIVQFSISIIILMAKIVLVKTKIKLPTRNYLINVLLRVGLATIIAFILPVILHICLSNSYLNLIITLVVALISAIMSALFVGLSKNERGILITIIKKIFANHSLVKIWR